jgi:hypothetical protein
MKNKSYLSFSAQVTKDGKLINNQKHKREREKKKLLIHEVEGEEKFLKTSKFKIEKVPNGFSLSFYADPREFFLYIFFIHKKTALTHKHTAMSNV